MGARRRRLLLGQPAADHIQIEVAVLSKLDGGTNWTAIFDTGNDKSVFVVKDRKLGLRIVKAGTTSGDVTEIETGLAKGDVLVLHPDAAMTDGQPLRN